MNRSISLNGEWKLYYFPDSEQDVSSPRKLKGGIPATVPGNVELDLAAAGVIPPELFKGMATVNNYALEDYTWWYEKRFTAPQMSPKEQVFLRFGAVDCLAEYYLNGEKIYESENAFMEVRFEVTDKLKKENILHVYIKSAVRFAYEQEYPQYTMMRAGEQTYLRKPAHSFGWDIFPRAVSAGIWKSVTLEVTEPIRLDEVSYVVTKATHSGADIRFFINLNIPYQERSRNVEVRLRGKCGENEFEASRPVGLFRRACNYFSVHVNNPKLWWPAGYGEANVYDLTCELLVDGVITDVKTMNLGIRTVQLRRTETMIEKDHCFQFVINGVNVMCKGSNWVPLNAYHSRDIQRYKTALDLFRDTHCNILRIWGGGVYEQEEFYDLCDRYGIMVWQDFMIACVPASMDEKTLANLRAEAVWAVKTLRSHPCIILWSGDNEIDECLVSIRRPGMNKITRELLPAIVEMHDSGRPYLASSPYLADEAAALYGKEDVFPERHLWGARDYFKADFYKNSRAHFVSETGYHGSPCLESIRKIVDEDCVWPIFNEQWVLHSSDQEGKDHRVRLMWEQIIQLFNFEPANIEDFILASQISQAEAKKFFIERVRIRKPYTSGVIWWNMLDGWPQMSDAVVDYFFQKKLAYHYIKRSQNPVALMFDEMHDWRYDLIASNDTLEWAKGSYEVTDMDTDEVLLCGEFAIAPNENEKLTSLRMYYPQQKMLLIKWTINGKVCYNHYLAGMPAFDFARYKGWLKKLNEFTGCEYEVQ